MIKHWPPKLPLFSSSFASGLGLVILVLKIQNIFYFVTDGSENKLERFSDKLFSGYLMLARVRTEPTRVEHL
jgi:hypothetical protein